MWKISPGQSKWARIALGVLVVCLATSYILIRATCQCGGVKQGGITVGADVEAQLRAHVEMLAGKIGERNYRRPRELERAAVYLIDEWKKQGFEAERQTYRASGQDFSNLIVEKKADEATETLILGAHYDSVSGAPGANDNGSGTAALLAISSALKDVKTKKNVRFVAFVNEEPPFFKTREMGSRVYAAAIKKRGDAISGMISLETMGYFTDEKNSQKYPPIFSWFYPSVGNFIAVVGDFSSAKLVNDVSRLLRTGSNVPVECAKTFSWVQGVDWSDHEAFWREGYPAVMITDTAPFRYPHYHTMQDLPDKLDYPRFARVVAGITKTVEALAN